MEEPSTATAVSVAAWSGLELREYQEAAFMAWALAGKRGLVVLPTGSGKTRLAMAAMARTGLRALCLVPTRALIHQWIEALSKSYSGPVGCIGDGRWQLEAVTVITFESAYRNMARLGNRFDLLIVDEAHHFGNKIRDEALEMSLAGARLGLTATPPVPGPAASLLAGLVGPTVFERAIGDLTGSFLAEFELIVLHLDLTREERRAYDTDMRIFREVHARFRDLAPDANWTDFARNAVRSAEGRAALAAWRRARRMLGFTAAKSRVLRSLLERHRQARVLIFTADNDTAYAIAREFLVMPITCDIGRKEREASLDRFRRGDLRTLVSARVLNEGIDVPEADVAIVVGAAQGEREHVQRVGRLLRPSAGKRALVYELVTRGTSEVRQGERRRSSFAAREPDPA